MRNPLLLGSYALHKGMKNNNKKIIVLKKQLRRQVRFIHMIEALHLLYIIYLLYHYL
jgi:hypothetical protein